MCRTSVPRVKPERVPTGSYGNKVQSDGDMSASSFTTQSQAAADRKVKPEPSNTSSSSYYPSGSDLSIKGQAGGSTQTSQSQN